VPRTLLVRMQTLLVWILNMFVLPPERQLRGTGTVDEKSRTEVVAIHFKESPPHSSLEWHTAPEDQYVLTLSGTLEFTTRDRETFVIRPRDVLVATDEAGSGHSWRLIDDQPWPRVRRVEIGCRRFVRAENRGRRRIEMPDRDGSQSPERSSSSAPLARSAWALRGAADGEGERRGRREQVSAALRDGASRPGE
jgi:quercetin dioxygenase-like cupin family protein